MLSGALLLGKEEDIKGIWKKRILRFVLVLVVFSIIQYVISVIYGEGSLDIIEFVRSIYSRPIRTSYWYLYAYISFLILLPFTRMIAQKLTEGTFWYLFLSAVVILDVMPILELIFGLGRYNLTLYLYGMNVLFPLLGYYLHNNWKTQVFKTAKSRRLLYACALLGVCITTGLMLYEKDVIGNFSETYITKFYIVTAVATFGGVKSLAEKVQMPNRVKQILGAVSNSDVGN